MKINRTITFEEGEEGEEPSLECQISNLKSQYEGLLTNLDLENQSEYIRDVIELMLKQKDSILIGVFGLGADEFVKKLTGILKSEKQFEKYLKYPENWLVDIGYIPYREEMPNVYFPILASIIHYEVNVKGGKRNDLSDYARLTYPLLTGRSQFERLNLGNLEEKEVTGFIEDVLPKQCDMLDAYCAFMCDDYFVDAMFKVCCYAYKWIFIWVKAYRFDFDLIEKLSKLKKAKVIIIISTLFDVEIAEKKLSEETLCDGARIINKYFNYNGIVTYVKV